MRFHFSASRYFVPACTGIAILTGYTFANWLRVKQIPPYIRYAVVFLVFGLTILYSVGLKLEMKQDTRVRAEAWFEKNIEKNVLIGSGMKRWYAPRLKFMGYKLIDGWHSEGVQTSRGMIKVLPDYLVMSNMFPCSSNYKDDGAFKKELYEGRAGYEQVACFKALYFYPSSSIFGIASWPYKRDMPDEWVSPTVDIFRKNDIAKIEIEK